MAIIFSLESWKNLLKRKICDSWLVIITTLLSWSLKRFCLQYDLFLFGFTCFVALIFHKLFVMANLILAEIMIKVNGQTTFFENIGQIHYLVRTWSLVNVNDFDYSGQGKIVKIICKCNHSSWFLLWQVFQVVTKQP